MLREMALDELSIIAAGEDSAASPLPARIGRLIRVVSSPRIETIAFESNVTLYRLAARSSDWIGRKPQSLERGLMINRWLSLRLLEEPQSSR